MFEGLGHFFKKIGKQDQKEIGSKDAAKERLHLVLMQDRANVSADFLELMKQEIIDVIEKYIVVDESQIDVRLTNLSNDDGTNGAPALFANIPIVNIKNDMVVEKSADFEGIDINKEMGLSKEEDSKIPEDVVKEIEEAEAEKLAEELKDENQEYDEESDEDDDDVTFDDLLKKAEEADRESKENEEKEETSEDEQVEEIKNEVEDASDLLKEESKEEEKEEVEETEETNETEVIVESEYDEENVEEKKAFKKKNRRKKNR